MSLQAGPGVGCELLRGGLGLLLGSPLRVRNLLELLLRCGFQLRRSRPVRRFLLLGELGSLRGRGFGLSGLLRQLLFLGGDPLLLGGALLAKLFLRFR